MTELTFGFSLAPTLDIGAHRELARAAEESGLQLLGIQDHPYVPDYLDTFVLAGELLAVTERISVFPDVANLPLRPPAMLAKTAAALDIVSGGRFELAMGAGGYWDAITRMGVARRSRGAANAALEEAIAIFRAVWGTGGPIHLHGDHYEVDGLRPGPTPPHPIGIWTGSQGPKSLELTGRIADGWAAPIPSYLPYEKWPEANAIIDEAAKAAGRRPGDVRRIAQLVGEITDRHGDDVRAEHGAAPVRGTVDQWAVLLARLAIEQPFTTFVFWPEQQTPAQVVRFGREVAPLVRKMVAEAG